MNNQYSKELCHSKSSKNNGADQQYREWYRDNDELKDQKDLDTMTRKGQELGSTSDTSKKKAYANRIWYLKNKQWKKDYNADYYQANKEYWQRRYREALASKRQAHAEADEYMRSYNSQVDEHNRFAKDWNNTRDEWGDNLGKMEYMQRMTDSSEFTKGQDLTYDIMKANMDRANKDYQWFMDTHKKESVAKIWSREAKNMVSKGRDFIKKIFA